MSETQINLMRKKAFTFDGFMRYALIGIASIVVLALILIILFIVMNSSGAISEVGIWEFLTGGTWKPSNDEYGAVPVIVGTILVTVGSVAFAVPLGIGAAVYMSEVADSKLRRVLKPAIEIFAGIPSVVYGFFGMVLLIPFLSDIFTDQMPTGFAWLTGSILLGLMALPTIISVAEDSLKAVPNSYREASLAMGATKWETTKKVVVPAAISGISAAIILGIGRAIGETMAVMMVTGNAAIVPEPLWNVFSMLRTITASLALEMPEVVVGSVHYSSLFVLATILMFMVFLINILAKVIVKRTQRKFAAEGDDVNFISKIINEKIDHKQKAAINEILMSMAIIVFSYMIFSLFIDNTYAIVASIGLFAAFVASKTVSKKIKSTDRQKVAHGLLLLGVVFIVLILVIMLGDIIINSIPALSLDFITEYPINGGESGGIFPAIIGTLELMLGTGLISIPLGILTGVYLAEYSRETKVSKIIRWATDLLNGTPSVVFGLFGMTALIIVLGLGQSLIAGCITLSIMILPVIIRTTEESIKSVPPELKEASMALGATKWQTVSRVVIPSALGGIITGGILGIGRAAGETAPIMFTAVVIMQNQLAGSIFEPIMALPYHLYYLATEGQADPSMQYATALVLLVIVLTLFLIANWVRQRSYKES